MEFGGDSVRVWREQMNAIDLGLPAAQLAELSAETRQSVLAMGGFETWVTRMDTANEDYFGYIGDTGKTIKYLARQMQLFGENGIKPSLAAMTDVTKTAGGTDKSLKQITSGMLQLGVPLEKQAEMQRTILEDEFVQAKLRAASSSQERTAIVRNLMARQLEYRAVGMSTEQALNASKALEAIGGKKPLDRYQQAAKATAALSAMGIEGAARVGEIIRMGTRASKADQEYVKVRLGLAEDTYAESKLLGRGYEFTIATLYEKGGFADLMGEGGLFSIKTKEHIKVTDKARDSVQLFGDRTTKVANTLTAAAMTTQEAFNALGSTIIGLLLGKGVLGAAAIAGIEAAMRGADAEGAIRPDEIKAKGEKLTSQAMALLNELGFNDAVSDITSTISKYVPDVEGAINRFHDDMNKRLDRISGSADFKEKVQRNIKLGKLIRGGEKTAEERAVAEAERAERMLSVNTGVQATMEQLADYQARSLAVMERQLKNSEDASEINKENATATKQLVKNTGPKVDFDIGKGAPQ